MRGKRILTVITSFAMVVSVASVGPVPAAAASPSPGVDQFVKTLTAPTDSLQDWTKGLGSIGKLADPLPAVQSSPGAAVGFGDLLSNAFSLGTKKVINAVDDNDLNIDQDIPFGDGRTGHLKTAISTVGADKHLSVNVTVGHDVLDQPLNIPVPIGSDSNAPQSAFTSTGGIKLHVDAALHFDLVWDSASDTVYIQVDNSGATPTPKLSVDAHASIDNVANVKAAIGILGVSLVNDSTLALNADFTASVSDPNNDGRLAFVNTDHSAGELAQSGSLAGLVSFGFATPAGDLTASLHLNAAAASVSLSLPAVDATIAVSWPDIATGTPTVTPTGLSVAGNFLNMTPRDLAAGIAQLATSLTSIQRAKSKTDPSFGNVDLPFLRGSLADAIQLNERLTDFLHKWTFPGPSDPDFNKNTDDPAKAGEPKFTSLQQFFDNLQNVLSTTGGGVSNIGFDQGSSTKLHFTLSLQHDAPANPIDLNAAAAASSGPATSPGHPANTSYTATTLSDPNQNWKPGEFVGRHVVAGSSGGTVASNTANTLTLDSNGWTPVTPSANQPYSISGAQGDVGVVALGNGLQTPDADQQKPGHGVANANAVNATAKVTPSYHASVTLVLDLQPPVMHDPPIQQQNPDGSSVLVDSTPTGADRVLLRTSGVDPLFTADFPIDASVDLYANAGFLQVHLTGDAHVCAKGTAPDCKTGTPPSGVHMVQVGLKDNGDITFGHLVGMLLDDPKQLLDFAVNVRGDGSVTASIPGADDFFPNGNPTAGFHWNDLTVLSASDADGPHIDFSALGDLAKVDFDPSNPRALFSIILKTLQTLDSALGSKSPTGPAHDLFATKIPVLGRSLGDLLKSDESGMGPQVTYTDNALKDASRSDKNGQAQPNAFPSTLVGRTVVVGGKVGIVQSVTHDTLTMASNWSGGKPADGSAYTARSELDDVISILENSPQDTMQQLADVVNKHIDPPNPLTFTYKDDATVDNTPSLVVTLHWKRAFSTSAPVQFDFSLPVGDQKLAGVQGTGSVALTAGGELTLGLVVPLKPGDGPAGPDLLKIMDNSSINVNLDASVDGTLATTIGPLSLSLGDPSQGATDLAHAKASYSVGLGKPNPSGNAESFTQFLADVSPTVNQNNTAVDCGFSGGTVDLALCARLPLYISNNGGQSYEKLITTAGHSNDFAVRLPDQPQNGASPFDVINPAGDPIDGHNRIETPDPGDLGDAIANQLIDLTRIDGIDSFLNLLQQSLQTASFGGKLPLVGKDLQQGADFIGNLKKTIDDALGDLAGVNSIGALRDWVNKNLAKKLEDAGLNPDLVKVDTQCNITLASVGIPTVELVNPADAAGTTYTYAIVAYIKDASGQPHFAKPGPDGEITNGPDPKADNVSPSKPLKISWDSVSVSGANTVFYKIYRRDGGDLKLLGDTGTNTTFTDDGTATPGAGPDNPSGDNPFFTDCDFSHFDSVLIRLDVSQGDFSGDTLNCQGLVDPHKCLSHTVPLDIGIPGLSLRAASPTDGPTFELGWRLHLAFGISRSDGFFVDTKDGDPQPEFAVGLNFTLPNTIKAQLGFINIEASNCVKSNTQDCESSAPDTPQPLFGGTFKIDITSPHSDGRLTLSDLSAGDLSSFFDIKLHAGVNIDLLLKATAFGDQGAGFPGIQAEFKLSWNFNNTDPTTDTGAGLNVAFDKVQIDTGKAFGEIIGPIIREIKKVTGPLDPVIKTLYAPIPVLSDLSHLVGGDDITLVSIAKAFSTIAGGPDLTFVDRVLKVIQIVNNLPVGDSVLIPIGSFQLVGTKALSNTATPDNTGNLIDQNSETLDGDASGPSGVLDTLDNHDGNGKHILNGSGENTGPKAGFTFPVFQHPASLFNLLLGGDVDLVQFDSGNLTLGFDWRQEFGPVYAPPPVLITLHGSASVTMRIVAGFDTFGIRKAIEAVRNGTFTAASVGDAILSSLYFKTTDDKGQPIPVVTFSGEIAAGAEVTAVIITVGVEGGVGLTVSFLWNDPNHDGKFRISEFLAAALNNPICLFTVSGRVFVFLKLYVSVGFGPFAVSFSFTIVNVTLLDFSATPNCSPPPPKTGALGDGGQTLVVYAAALGDAAHRGDSNWDSNKEDTDTVKITSLHNYDAPGNPFTGVAVEMLGIRNEFLNANIKRVIVDGRGYQHPMSVTFLGDGRQDVSGTGPKPPTLSFEKDAIVFGGDKNDQIKTGIGNSYVDGGPGDDTIVTGDRTVLKQDPPGTGDYSYVNDNAKAWVAGGGGNDSITVGNGDDRVSGDGTLIGAENVTVTNPKELKNSKNPADNVDSGDPTETVGNITVPDWTKHEPNGGESGTQGDDIVSVGLGAAKAYGNGGKDTLSVAADNELVKSKPSQASLFTSAGATLVGGTGDDHIAGGSGPDTIFTGPDAGGLDTDTEAVGGSDDGSKNVVDTGTGNDTVYGSTGVDLVTGHSLPAQHDNIRGGKDDDILIGGFGTDTIFGGPGQDYVIAEPSTVDLGNGPPQQDGIYGPLYTVTHTPLPDGTAPSPKTLVGGTGDDHIIGGDGGANIDGDGYNQTTRCGPGTPVASDPVSEAVNTPQDGNDKITGGAGVDNVRAGGGNDLVDAAGNDDLVCGEKGNDTLGGGPGDDQAWGGSDQDVIYGDTGADRLYGNTGNDFIYGGNQNDTIEGNDDSDYVSGGDGDDHILGGTRAAGRTDVGDWLNGDNGQDTIIGDNGGTVNGLWQPFDLDGANPAFGGKDLIYGGNDDDLAYGGLDDDTMFGGAAQDHFEGNNAKDTIYGDDGEDELVGGGRFSPSAGKGYPDGQDTIFGGGGPDVITGDNAIVDTVPLANSTQTVLGRGFTFGHSITLLDLGANAAPNTADGDILSGNGGTDVIYGQGGADRMKGNEDDDYLEGNQASDWIEGDTGDDDLVGGSSTPAAGSGNAITGQADEADAMFGGPGDDGMIGDNGVMLRIGDRTRTFDRIGSTAGLRMSARNLTLYDLGANVLTTPSTTLFGADRMSGGAGVDVMYGQDGADQMSGGPSSDYLEGNGGADLMQGDRPLFTAPPVAGEPVTTQLSTVWPGTASGAADLEGSGPDGQDDMIGGSSIPGFRDVGDNVEGDGEADFQLGDNGVLMRDLVTAGGVLVERVFAKRYPADAAPANAAVIRIGDPAVNPNGTTRFCTAAQATCEVAGASGNDTMFGDGGDDTMWGQDGNDTMRGGADNDNMYGELGDDTMYGEAGDDAMVGDRGGIVDQYEDGSRHFAVDVTQVPKIHFDGFLAGSLTRQTDLQHDINGDAFVATSTSAAMVHRGDLEGGNDRMRGGTGHDSMHGGFGDDLMNGDSGGDNVLGDDGADVLWGGKGCDANVDTAATSPDCYPGGVFDPNARGTNDRMVDYLLGGKGATSGPSVDPNTGDLGSDILDWHPRGVYGAPGAGTCTANPWPQTFGGKKAPVTEDPCTWFEMTNLDNGDGTDNQHHQGIDWMYGGWDRDVLQGDVADNGPNDGDRLLDWTGAYNLYTHCNSAYGGYNDVRQHSPDWQTFLQDWTFAIGGGQVSTDPSTDGTSAFDELALVYPGTDNDHGSGSAFPSTPGHFDDPNACAP